MYKQGGARLVHSIQTIINFGIDSEHHTYNNYSLTVCSSSIHPFLCVSYSAMRESMSGEELDWFRRNVQCTVEKDVVRTDRSNPCFAGNDNPNLEKMKRILLNFAVHNPVMG